MSRPASLALRAGISRAGPETLGEIAGQVGYEAEAAPPRSNSSPRRRKGSPHCSVRRCAGLHKPDGTNSRQPLPDDHYLAAMLA